MTKKRHPIQTIILALLFGITACLGFSLCGCKKKEVTSKTEVKDKLFGGTEVKKTEVTTQGDKVQVKETKTDVNREGTKVKTEVTTKGDEIK
jgi:hypothetical protein